MRKVRTYTPYIPVNSMQMYAVYCMYIQIHWKYAVNTLYTVIYTMYLNIHSNACEEKEREREERWEKCSHDFSIARIPWTNGQATCSVLTTTPLRTHTPVSPSHQPAPALAPFIEAL